MHPKEIATQIVLKLNHAGYKAYFAGGWVRDYLMEHPSDDIDIATDAPPQVILDLFPHTLLVGLAFGVVIVVVGNHQFEVSTFRRDIEYINGRRPESIELSTPEEDALRRDFTINGMFYDPIEEKIYDFVHGMEDLKKGIIRTIGDPFERFAEDRLRMIRAIRFAARFGFPIEPETQVAIQENAETLFPAVAIERVWNEFIKMSRYPRLDQAFIDMHRLGLLPVIFPDLKMAHLNEIKHNVRAFSHFPKITPPILYLTALFPHYDAKKIEDLCLYLRTSTQDLKCAQFMQESKKILNTPEKMNDVLWVYFYGHSLSNLCLDIHASYLEEPEKHAFYELHHTNQKRLRAHIQRVIEKTPLVTSSHLKSEGILEGKQMGTLLKEAEQKAILYNLNNAQDVLRLLKTSEKWPLV